MGQLSAATALLAAMWAAAPGVGGTVGVADPDKDPYFGMCADKDGAQQQQQHTCDRGFEQVCCAERRLAFQGDYALTCARAGLLCCSCTRNAPAFYLVRIGSHF
jgi:hypothetical protein